MLNTILTASLRSGRTGITLAAVETAEKAWLVRSFSSAELPWFRGSVQARLTPILRYPAGNLCLQACALATTLRHRRRQSALAGSIMRSNTANAWFSCSAASPRIVSLRLAPRDFHRVPHSDLPAARLSCVNRFSCLPV